MNKWIVYSLKYRKGQAGFALPVAIGMGLIILLVGLTMLLRSQDSQVSAIAQKDTAKSLNAAETGVNEIRALINQHRAIAKYPACVNRNTDGSCADTGSTESWALPNNIPNILAVCNVDETAEIATVAQQSWQLVDPNLPNQGEYRLLAYKYNGGTGTLTVQGRVNAAQPSESISELEVSFRAMRVEEPAANLWTINTADTSQVSVTTLGPCSSSSPIQPSGLNMPAIPSVPVNPPSNVTSLNGETLTDLPRPVDSADTDGIYRYTIDVLNQSFKVDLNKQIELWVEGDIDLKDQEITCGTSSCNSLSIKIFGQGTPGTISINNGTKICNVFIHAPDYDVTSALTGSPKSDCDTGTSRKVTGVFWVREWGGSGSSPPVLNTSPIIEWNKIPENLFDYPRHLGPIQTWETQEKSSG